MSGLTFIADTIVYLPVVLLSLGLLIGIGYIFYHYRQHNAVPPPVLFIINGIIKVLKFLIVKPIKLLLQILWWLFPIMPSMRDEFGYVKFGAWDNVNRARSISLLLISIFIITSIFVYSQGYPSLIQDYSTTINCILIILGFIFLILAFISFNRDVHYGNPTDPWPTGTGDGIAGKRANWLFRTGGTYLFYTIALALLMAILTGLMYFVSTNGLFSITGTTILMVLASIGLIFLFYQIISSSSFFVNNIAKNSWLRKLFYVFFIIPCLFFDTVRYFYLQFRGTPKVVYSVFAVEILLILLYIIGPMVINYMYTAMAPQKNFSQERIKRKINSINMSNIQIKKTIKNIKNMTLDNYDYKILHSKIKGQLWFDQEKMKDLSTIPESGWKKIISNSYSDPKNEEELTKFLIDYGYKTNGMCDDNPYIKNKSSCKEKIEIMIKYIQTITPDLVRLQNQVISNIENLEKLTLELANVGTSDKAKVLLADPVYLKNKKIITDFASLKIDDFEIEYKYNYTISGWFFIRAQAPNFGESYSKYTSILNYGNKPNILYNGKLNKLKIKMNNGKKQKPIVHIIKDFPLQTWTNIVVTYNGGTLDIFLNGKLIASIPNVVPYMNHDPLSVGDDYGIGGGVCNVVYFPNVISLERIKMNYNALKNSNPPVIYPSSI
jgi:hypothetical protein